MKVKIKDIFNINQGHQITDEEIYSSIGSIPIFTGNNIIKGYGKNSIVSMDELPCVTYPTKGNVGTFYIQENLFDANNTAVLTLKNEWKNKINLYWFVSHISSIVKKEMNSKEGVGYIGKDIMENITIKIIPLIEQRKIGELYQNMDKINIRLTNEIKKLENLINVKWEMNSNFEEFMMSDLFDIYGGQSLITEEFIYNNSPKSDEDIIKVFSGKTLEEPFGYISHDTKKKFQKLKIYEGPCILIVRKGKAGSMFYIDEKEFVINDDAYVMYPKENFLDKINLIWFINHYQDLFIKISSKSDNGTFSKNRALTQLVKIYSIDEQEDIAQKISEINKIIRKLYKIRSDIEKLISNQIIS